MQIQTEARSFQDRTRLIKKLQNDSYPHQITVCVPIYNTECWLSQCLDSLVAQDIWEKIFIILVNDGSEDGSLKIARNFAQEYSKNTLLINHGENKGLLAARYSAIMHIETPFAMFVDSDDLLPPSACSNFYDVIVAKEADVVIGQMRKLRGKDITNDPGMNYFFQCYSETDNLRLQGDFDIAGSLLCGKIYQSKLLKMVVHGINGRAFPAISYGEDTLLSTAVFMESQKIFLANKIVYYYRNNEKSLTMNSSNKSIIHYIIASINVWKLAIYYDSLGLAELGGRMLNWTEHEFFNSELCFPYRLNMLNKIASMNKIANKLGENFQISNILEQENKLIKEFGIPKMFEILDIPECKNLYKSKKYKIKNQNTLNSGNYHFHQLEFKKKVRAIARTFSKKIGIYRLIRIFLNIFRKFLFNVKKPFNDS